MTEEQQKFYDIKNFSDYKVVGEDWKNNFDFLPKKISFFGKSVYTTRGYARAYDSGRNDFMFDFTNACVANDGYKTVIRGWSFGSAMVIDETMRIYLSEYHGTSEEVEGSSTE